MDQYAEEKRREKNLIVRSGISESETTNNKRLRSTFCIEAIQTRSIAWPLCDSRASCIKCLITTRRTNKESLTIRLLLQQSVSGVAVSLLVSELTVVILSTFYGVFVVHCVNLMLICCFFLIWGCSFCLFCLPPKYNLSETFHQV